MGRTNENGFTLVELLCVMLIIGLLAAIAIPSFFGQRDKALDAEAKAAVRTAQTAIEVYATDQKNGYSDPPSGTIEAELTRIEPTLEEVSGRLDVSGNSRSEYTITVSSEVAGQTFTIRRDPGGSTTIECGSEGKAGCPLDGSWG